MTRPSKPDKQLSLIEDDLTKMAFDEMNLVELPFALLTDAREAQAAPVRQLPLASDDLEKLVTTEDCLPTALAERVVLGLLWMTQAKNGFEDPTVRFALRQLIHEFMYPDRSPTNRVSGAFFKRVEREIHHIAHTRIVSNRWYDKRLGKKTQMNAAIIDYVQVIEEGGRNRPRILEIRWGDKLFKSVRDRYTKSIDVHTVLRIDRPLDLRFYRWLDRQLATKERQLVVSCQKFAKYKLLMRGQKIDRGGRTASSYIVRKLKEALLRLDSLGFSVRMTAHESTADFSLEFERIDAAHPNETVEIDRAADLVLLFQNLAHGRPTADNTKRNISNADRQQAQRWLEAYGYEKAAWMVERCLALHRASTHAERTLYLFKALAFYESKADGDYSRHQAQKESADLERRRQQAAQAWERYKEEQLAAIRKQLGARKLQALEAEISAQITEEYAGRAFRPSGVMLRTMVEVEVDLRLLNDSDALSEDAFVEKWLDECATYEKSSTSRSP